MHLSDRVKNEEVLFYAATLAKLGRYQESISTIQKLLPPDYSSNRLRVILAFNYFKLGKLDDAQKIIPNATEEQLESLIKNF